MSNVRRPSDESHGTYDAIPDELKDRAQWLPWSTESDPPKAPLDANGNATSWTDPGEWFLFERARKLANTSPEFDGIGFVVAENDPYLAFDFDDCLREPRSEKPKEWVPPLDPFTATWMEYSMSGFGIHAITRGDGLPKKWSNSHFSDEGHEGVEAYTSKFIAMTGETVESAASEITEVDVVPFLVDAYEAINGHPMELAGQEDTPDTEAEIGVYDVISRASYPEEENTSHPFHPSSTGTNFRVDAGGDTFRCWRHGVTGNGAHLLGIEQGVIECGEWADSGLDSKTWREIFDAAREVGYDIPTPTTLDDADSSRQPRAERPESTGIDSTTSANGWDDVADLLQADRNGSTTEAYSVASRLLNERHDIAVIRESGEVYFFEETKGYYVRKGATYIEELLTKKLAGHVNSNRVRNIREQVISLNYVSSDEFQPPEDKVCVQNGVLDLATRELEPHSPEYYFTSRLQVPYDPDADANLWSEFLSESVATEKEKDKLEEFIGYALEPWHHKREKNLFVVGPSRSGKSTFSDVVKSLFGEMPSVTNLTPQQIADTQFDVASLKEAMLNTVNDINASKIEDTGSLKRVFSGEPLKLERKHQDAHFGAPKVKHLFTANWLPSLVGQDEAFFRRVLIVEFPEQIPDDEKDLELKQKLKHERAGILNRALDARERLQEQGRFTNDRTMTETRRVWDSWQDAHKRFLYTQFHITGDSEDRIDKKAYYRAYKEYAGRENYEIKPKQGVTKSLQWVPEIVATDECYRGLRWRQEDVVDADSMAQSQLPD